MSTEIAPEGHPEHPEPVSEREVAFFVNDERIVVYATSLTVREILDDAGLSVEAHALVHRSHDGSEVLYADPDEAVHLSEGLRLYTRPRLYHITVNGRARSVETDVLTYDEVIKLSDLPPPTDGVEYLVTFSDAVQPPDGDLVEGESVRIKDGTYFVVSPSNRS